MPSPSKASSTLTKDQVELQTMTFLQVEALKPQRQVKVRTAGFKTKKPYVPGASLRLWGLTTLANKGFLTSMKVEKVGGWCGESCHLHEKEFYSSHSSSRGSEQRPDQSAPALIRLPKGGHKATHRHPEARYSQGYRGGS